MNWEMLGGSGRGLLKVLSWHFPQGINQNCGKPRLKYYVPLLRSELATSEANLEKLFGDIRVYMRVCVLYTHTHTHTHTHFTFVHKVPRLI
jgi:hypothetical protein